MVPSVEYDGDDEVMRAYMARSAGDMGVAAQIEGLMAQAMLPEEIEGFGQLLDAHREHRLRQAARLRRARRS